MRLRSVSNVVATLATASSIVTTGPATHQHGHTHVDKRAVKVVDVPGPVVIAYELNGRLIDQSEVCEGIHAGTLKFADGSDTLPACSKGAELVSKPEETPLTLSGQHTPVAPVLVPSTVLATSSFHEAQSEYAKEAIRVSSTPIAEASSNATPTSSDTLPAQTKAPSPTSTNVPDSQGLDKDFPDGQIDCTKFPSEYGPINVEWADLGGWSGIQYITIKGNFVTHIDTAVPGGEGCKPGAMCSYACPPGYQKSQWPPQQGATGQSVGGLSCNSNGKLGLTNPGLSKKLCIKGTGAVTVQNKLSNNAAICRTDYPGTENEVVPLNTQPDSIHPLTCPDASTYFKHNGDPTTAQYYINNQGVALQHACIWGTDGSGMGNWAPSYLGVGKDTQGKTWLSIASTAQNDPMSYTPLNFTVKIMGHTSGNCGLRNGKYCSGESYEHCNEKGCTVELMSGQATYILADH